MQRWETWVGIGLHAQPQAQYIHMRAVTIQSGSARWQAVCQLTGVRLTELTRDHQRWRRICS